MDDTTWTIVIFSIVLLILIILIGLAVRLGQIVNPVLWKDTIYDIMNDTKSSPKKQSPKKKSPLPSPKKKSPLPSPKKKSPT